MTDIKFKPIPEHSDHMSMKKFKKYCKGGMFIDYDGFGYLATSTQTSDVYICPSMLKKISIPSWATHVVWFNR
jgi:transcription termination factor Rho